MKNLTWQNPEQLFFAQELINKVKSKCCGINVYKKDNDNLQLLTTDHIAVGGNTTFLTPCINGKGFREQVPVERVSVNDGDIIFMCSDGYYQNKNQLSADLSDDTSVIEIIFE